MQNITDFLIFKIFISKYIFIFVYYILAILIPIIIFGFRKVIVKKMDNILNIKHKIAIFIILVLIISCMELCLRMFTEIIVAYFNIEEHLR